MATGRTLQRWARMYINLYKIELSAQSFGSIGVDFNTWAAMTISDAVRGGLPTQPKINAGPINGVLNFYAGSIAGISDISSYVGTTQVINVPIGIRAAPAAGDPAFCGYFGVQKYDFEGQPDGSALVHIELGDYDPSNAMTYTKPWGRVIHNYTTATAANTGTGVDWGASSSAGGYMAWCGYSDATNHTISIEESDDDITYTELTGATTGVITSNATTSGIVQLATTATVKQYLRWQVARTGGTYVEFYIAFVRG